MAATTRRALESLRASGRRLILVTGETLDELAHFPHLALFHRIVAENGAVLARPGGEASRLAAPPPEAFVRSLRGEPMLPFHYFDKGNLATIGRSAAVADFGRLRLSGFPAWVSWAFVHIFFLIGFKNRLLVMIEWAWMWLTYKRGARLITGTSDARM